MPKIHEAELARLKKIQDVDDDDAELDVTKRKRLHPRHAPAHSHEDEEEQQENPETEKKTTRNLLITIGGILAISLIFWAIATFYNPVKTVPTVDELHELNLAGKLNPSQGYIYNGYSFVNFSGIWYSRVQKGNTTYEISFNNDPRSVEKIPVEGKLSSTFLDGDTIHITFDPDAREAKYITVANAGLSMSLIKGFGYKLVASCTDNESMVCQKNGVVQCGDPGRAVVYFKEDTETKIFLNESCITIQGSGPELVKAKDRLLLDWYGMIGQKKD
jgi:hypothetical protein